MSFAVLATVFGIVFVAELPDKTALASLVLGTRYRPAHVFAGVAGAFAVHVAIALVAGSLLGLLPHRVLAVVVGLLFLLGAGLLLRRRDEDGPETGGAVGEPPAEEPLTTGLSLAAAPTGLATLTPPRTASRARTGFWRVAGTSFLVLFVAEFGDLTQIATANLAARYDDPWAVGIGATLGLWAVGGLAVTGGRQLLRVVPFAWITRIAATAMIVMAAINLIGALA